MDASAFLASAWFRADGIDGAADNRRASSMNKAQQFAGLPERLPVFLRELERNNSRKWFLSHRDEYRDCVAQPLQALAEFVAPDVWARDQSLAMKLSRPNRDLRFARDKSPYRTEMWFAFRQDQPDWTNYPAFFFEVTPEQCRWGMGYFSASPATVSALRDVVARNPERYLKALASATKRGFSLQGEPYKKPPVPPDGMPDEIIDLYRRRNAYLSRIASYGPLELSGEFATVVADDFAALNAMYDIFRRANFK
jgi:uncharacterized protein (TIGR02453 family)